MEEELKSLIAARITSLLQTVQTPDTLGQLPSLFSSREGVAFALGEQAFKQYIGVLRSFLEDAKWGETVSRSFLDDRVRALIGTMKKEGVHESQEVIRYLDHLTAEIENISEIPTVCLSILGMGLDVDAFPIANLTLKKYTDTVADELVERSERILHSTRAIPGETEAQARNNQEQLVKLYKDELDRFKSGILVERRFPEPIEPIRARERTEEETRRLIDLFRYVIAFLYPESDERIVGLQGDVRLDTRSTFTFSNLDAVYLNLQHTGLRRSFVLQTKDKDAMSHIGIFAMSEVLKKPQANLTDYERMLIRGLQLFSDSQTQFERQSQFIGLWNCIENFISPERSIKDAVSKRGAFLLTPEHSEMREETRKWLRQEYGIRSDLSHGTPRTITDEDLATLRWAAVIIIRWMIKRRGEFKTRSDLFCWLKIQTLKIWPKSSFTHVKKANSI